MPSPKKAKILAEVMDARSVDRTLGRLAHEIVERNRGIEQLVIIGLRTRGVPLAKRLIRKISEIEGMEVPFGSLDVTLYRDDFSNRPQAIQMQATDIHFSLDDKTVVIVDDVLYTGRTVRAALDAIMDFGRPARVELAVMIDRGHRELPIKADYIGKTLLTSLGEEVAVKLEQVDESDGVYLVEPN